MPDKAELREIVRNNLDNIGEGMNVVFLPQWHRG